VSSRPRLPEVDSCEERLLAAQMYLSMYLDATNCRLESFLFTIAITVLAATAYLCPVLSRCLYVLNFLLADLPASLPACLRACNLWTSACFESALPYGLVDGWMVSRISSILVHFNWSDSSWASHNRRNSSSG